MTSILTAVDRWSQASAAPSTASAPSTAAQRFPPPPLLSPQSGQSAHHHQDDMLARIHTETDRIFQQHTIQEVRAIELKNRGAIDAKKGQLRVMVADRYRDVLETTDSIMAMQRLAGKLSTTLTPILQTGPRQNLGLTTGQITREEETLASPTIDQRERQDFATAALLKLLLDTPEQMWHLLTQDALLEAAQLYLLASQVYKTVQPLIQQRQSGAAMLRSTLLSAWDAVFYFRQQIIDRADAYLRDDKQSNQMLLRAMLAIMKLDAIHTARVLKRFLQQRAKQMQSDRLRHDMTSLLAAVQAMLYTTQHLFVKRSLEDHIKAEPALEMVKLLSPKTVVRLVRQHLPEGLLNGSIYTEGMAGPSLQRQQICDDLVAFIAEVREHLLSDEQQRPRRAGNIAAERFAVWQATALHPDADLFSSLGLAPDLLWRDLFDPLLQHRCTAILQHETSLLKRDLVKLIEDSANDVGDVIKEPLFSRFARHTMQHAAFRSPSRGAEEAAIVLLNTFATRWRRCERLLDGATERHFFDRKRSLNDTETSYHSHISKLQKQISDERFAVRKACGDCMLQYLSQLGDSSSQDVGRALHFAKLSRALQWPETDTKETEDNDKGLASIRRLGDSIDYEGYRRWAAHTLRAVKPRLSQTLDSLSDTWRSAQDAAPSSPSQSLLAAQHLLLRELSSVGGTVANERAVLSYLLEGALHTFEVVTQHVSKLPTTDQPTAQMAFDLHWLQRLYATVWDSKQQAKAEEALQRTLASFDREKDDTMTSRIQTHLTQYKVLLHPFLRPYPISI